MKKVLIVDDDEKNRKLLKDLLTFKGFEVTACENGKETLEKTTSDMLFAILDLRLPDISGYEVAKQLKEKFPKLPLIVYTASPLKEEIERLRKNEIFESILLKPIRLENFEEVMKKYSK